MTTPTTAVQRAEGAHLSDALLARLRDRLVTQCANQAARIAALRVTVTELTGQMDVDSLLEREVAEAAIERSNGAVIEIFSALLRLDAGMYGTCEQCRRPIPSERLEAIPHARLCVSCLRIPATRRPGAHSG
jgi:DnaK suppressor protein